MTRPKPVYGKNKKDDALVTLPMRYSIVVFNMCSKQEDKVKTYMSDINVDVLEIKRLSSDEHFVHSLRVVIYRIVWSEDVGCIPFVFKKKLPTNNGYINYLYTELCRITQF